MENFLKDFRRILFVALGFGLPFVMLFISACSPQPAVDPSSVSSEEKVGCTAPDAPENGNSWVYGACSTIDTQVYEVTIILRDMENHEENLGRVSGSAYGGYAHVSGRFWEEGKGIVTGDYVNIYPPVDWIDPSMPIIVKTTDLKVMGVPDGAEVVLLCNRDVEVVPPVKDSQILTTDRETNEFDDCRMKTPQYNVPAGATVPADSEFQITP